MDLSNIIASPDRKVVDLPRQLIAPTTSTVPEDGFMEYVVVETLADVLQSGTSKVLLVDDDNTRLLKCVVEYFDLLGFKPSVLIGLPGATYSNAFDSATYSLERVSYTTMIAELVEFKNIADIAADEDKSDYEREKERFTRKNGKVKELDIPGAPGVPDANANDDNN